MGSTTPQNILDRIFKNNTYANNNGVQTAGSVPVLGGSPGIFNNGMYAFNGPQAAVLGGQMQAALAARQSKPIFDNQIIAINTAAPPAGTTTTPVQNQPTQQPQIQQTPFVGTEGMFTGQYYGATANPMTWQIQPGGLYVEAHGAGGGPKTLQEIAAMPGLSKAYVGMDLVDLGTAAQHYAPKQQPLAQQAQPYKMGIAPGYGASGYGPGSNIAWGGSDAFSRDMGAGLGDEFFDQRQELNSIMNSKGGGPSISGANANLYGSIIGATNAAGKMINTAYGGMSSDEQMLRDTMTNQSGGRNMDITKQNFVGTPFYQLNGGSTASLPYELQQKYDQYKMFVAGYTDPQAKAQYQANWGSVGPDMVAVNEYIQRVPQDLQWNMQRWAQSTLPQIADARAAINGWSDPVAYALSTNHHIMNQAYDQPGAQFQLPVGNQKGRILRQMGTQDPALLAWADLADQIADEINPAGNWGAGISPSYTSQGMGNPAGTTVDYASTGNGGNKNSWTGTAPAMIRDSSGAWSTIVDPTTGRALDQFGPQWGLPNSGLPDWMQPNPSPFRNNPGGQVWTSPTTNLQTSAKIVPSDQRMVDGSGLQAGTPQYDMRGVSNGTPGYVGSSGWNQASPGNAQAGNMMSIPGNINAVNVDGSPATVTDQGHFLSWYNNVVAAGLNPSIMTYMPPSVYQPVVSGGIGGGAQGLYRQ